MQFLLPILLAQTTVVAQPLYTPTSAEQIGEVISGGYFSIDEGVQCGFVDGTTSGTWKCHVVMGPEEPASGTWDVKGKVISARTPKYKVRIVVKAISDWGVVVGEQEMHEIKEDVVLVRGPLTAPAGERNIFYQQEVATQLIPGSTDRTIYDELREKGSMYFPLFTGSPAKNPRETSEIWYLSDHKKLAWYTAANLAPIIGSVEPKEWKWGGNHGVIVIAGKRKAEPRKTGTVVILDAGCEGFEDKCEDDLSKQIASEIEKAGWRVVRHEDPKNRKGRSGVYVSRKDMREAAFGLHKHLAELLGAKSLLSAGFDGTHLPVDCDAVVYVDASTHIKFKQNKR